MSIDSFVPYVPNLKDWEKHFTTMATQKLHSAQPQKQMYVVSPQTGHGDIDIKMVSPTEQAVNMAKETLKRQMPRLTARRVRKIIKRRANKKQSQSKLKLRTQNSSKRNKNKSKKNKRKERT